MHIIFVVKALTLFHLQHDDAKAQILFRHCTESETDLLFSWKYIDQFVSATHQRFTI